MTNNQLPAEVQERIKADADKFSYMGLFNGKPLCNDDKLKGYIAGATAENERAQAISDALDQFISYHETGLLPAKHVYENAIKVREHWKGKDMPVMPEFDYETRETIEKPQPAPPEAIKRMHKRWIAEGKRQCPDCGLWFKSEGRCPECNPLG